MYSAELKSPSYGTDVAGTLRIYFVML